MNSRIEQIINEMEDYIDSCKPAPLSQTKIIVNREEMEELINELRLKTPDEIKKYQKLISNKDAILADARSNADQLIRDAQIHTEALVNEHEIMQVAKDRANEVIRDAQSQAQSIVNQATEDANSIRLGALRYTDEMLANLQMLIEHSLESAKAKYESLITALTKDLEIVTANRAELLPSTSAKDEEDLAANVAEMMDDDDDDIEVDEI